MTTGGGWIAEKVKLLAAAASTSEAGIMMITDYVYCDFTVLLVLLSEILKLFVQLTVPTEVRAGRSQTSLNGKLFPARFRTPKKGKQRDFCHLFIVAKLVISS